MIRQFLILAAAVLVGGSYAAHFADRAVMHAPPQVATVQPVGKAPQATNYGRSLTLLSDRQGHFHAEARIDGQPIDVMIDSGASLVALRVSDAADLGIRPLPGDYTATVITANGTIKAARTTLDRVEIGDITVDNVPALVLPDTALEQDLLGVSFLSRLARYEYADGRLVLEQ